MENRFVALLRQWNARVWTLAYLAWEGQRAQLERASLVSLAWVVVVGCDPPSRPTRNRLIFPGLINGGGCEIDGTKTLYFYHQPSVQIWRYRAPGIEYVGRQ
eukprot:scaffold114735_cov34-Tisochrysis_lutea.AAC.4